MKLRLTTTFVLLLYLTVALVLGVVHHHDQQLAAGHGNDCAACVWHVTGNSDAPVVTTPISFVVRWLTPHVVQSVPVICDFIPATASRAPPLSPA